MDPRQSIDFDALPPASAMPRARSDHRETARLRDELRGAYFLHLATYPDHHALPETRFGAFLKNMLTPLSQEPRAKCRATVVWPRDLGPQKDRLDDLKPY